ncbi:AraC family transcriptional regulator [Kaustia mangrovi]|uniref:AraC family transcriptional regulator n=1 Tax=Kaustia mangrovi TaxID=2593653 RepID=A0A7S8C166_9HYPH|nr:AraC family transcriptional regulator [Kaustia mangrovi]QPC41478.1 AraC family transcriptional regulator [Kaustia mangrovi]
MDVLTEICAALRLKASLYFRAELHGPFAIRLPQERHHIRFHCLLEGDCLVTVPGAPPERLEKGDLTLVPDGTAQTLSSVVDAGPLVDLADVLAANPPRDGVLAAGSGSPRTSILCGFLAFDELLRHPVFAGLPAVMVLKSGAPPFAAALRLLGEEAALSGPGATMALHKIVEILLMQALRDAAGAGGDSRGFVAALRDARLGRGLVAIHAEPHRPWTIDTLSGLAGMSRSSFSDRFTTKVGMSPHAYLTRWRMIRAREMLAEAELDMTAIAERCGYGSVPAFTRRFKETFGMAPGAWRRQAIAGT